ncbi:hypothetical protein RHMOL_Rhmol07G0291700 [Rhododendron molle]|uniref:Uncharacterized protein n=1 Tax=Rhododendron molle TaxID=49168 RepID=A0ACC0N5P9_RHOML|nr:hypothetical protein RHMOL_Rhmol07G0291700 [Rhododendron molle]
MNLTRSSTHSFHKLVIGFNPPLRLRREANLQIYATAAFIPWVDVTFPSNILAYTLRIATAFPIPNSFPYIPYRGELPIITLRQSLDFELNTQVCFPYCIDQLNRLKSMKHKFRDGSFCSQTSTKSLLNGNNLSNVFKLLTNFLGETHSHSWSWLGKKNLQSYSSMSLPSEN